MSSEDYEIKKILVFSLSNIGDVVLTFPVIDVLIKEFPKAQISVAVGPKAAPLLDNNPHIFKTYVFDKRQFFFNHIPWIIDLAHKRFDLVVDLRNTAIPFLVFPKYRTPLDMAKHNDVHRKAKHLLRLKTIVDFHDESAQKHCLKPRRPQVTYVDALLQGQVSAGQGMVVVSPGAANHHKRWHRDGFAQVCDRLIAEQGVKVVFVGDKGDQEWISSIMWKMKNKPLDLSCQTTLLQLVELVSRSRLVLANDSALMHIASYLDIPTVAIFGPTDPKKYGPWGTRGCVVKKDVRCAPCEKSGCEFAHECMKQISVDDVYNAVRSGLSK